MYHFVIFSSGGKILKNIIEKENVEIIVNLNLETSRFSKLLLKNYEEFTMAFLIGVMLGTLKIPVVNIASNVAFTIPALLPCIIVAVIAFMIIIIMETQFNYIE